MSKLFIVPVEQGRHDARDLNSGASSEVRMSWVRVGALLLLGAAVGVGGVLMVEGNPAPVSLHLGLSGVHAEVSLWLVIAFSFLGGIIATGVLAGTARLDGPFFHVFIGIVFVLVLCAVAAILGIDGTVGASLLVGLVILVIATAWEGRTTIAAAVTGARTGLRTTCGGIWAALGAIHLELTSWIRGLTRDPPEIASPPPSGIALLVIILLAPVLMGSTILVRAALVLALAAAGIVAVLRALTLVRLGEPIELRARSAGLGGGQGGWRLSQPGSLLLIAGVVLGAAVGLAQVDRRLEPRSTDTKPSVEVAQKKDEAAAKRVEAGKESQTSPSGAISAPARQ